MGHSALSDTPVPAWPTAMVPSELSLLPHGLTQGCSSSRGVGALLWACPWPHALRCSSMTSGTATVAPKCTCCSMDLPTATDTLRCIFSSVDLTLAQHSLQRCTCCSTDISMATDMSRCTYSGMGLSMATDVLGCRAPCGHIHRSHTVPLTLSSHWSSSLSSTAAMPWACASSGTQPLLLLECSLAWQRQMISTTGEQKQALTSTRR